MRTNVMRLMGGLTVLALGVGTVSAGVRGTPYRLRAVEQTAQTEKASGSKGKMVLPRGKQDLPSSTGGVVISPPLVDVPLPPPPHGIGHPHVLPHPPGPHHPPHAWATPAHPHVNVVHAGHVGSGCGCDSMMAPPPLVVHPASPCSSCGGCSRCGQQCSSLGCGQCAGMSGSHHGLVFGHVGVGAGVIGPSSQAGLLPSYGVAFPNGYYRSGAEAGMNHFPYYSYRRPWYFPGQPSFHRDTDIVW